MATASTDGDFSAHTLQPWAQAHRFQCLIHTTRREARGPHTCLCAWRLPGPQTSEADVAPRVWSQPVVLPLLNLASLEICLLHSDSPTLLPAHIYLLGFMVKLFRFCFKHSCTCCVS